MVIWKRVPLSKKGEKKTQEKIFRIDLTAKQFSFKLATIVIIIKIKYIVCCMCLCMLYTSMERVRNWGHFYNCDLSSSNWNRIAPLTFSASANRFWFRCCMQARIQSSNIMTIYVWQFILRVSNRFVNLANAVVVAAVAAILRVVVGSAAWPHITHKMVALILDEIDDKKCLCVYIA